jgi:L-arabinose isomerase
MLHTIKAIGAGAPQRYVVHGSRLVGNGVDVVAPDEPLPGFRSPGGLRAEAGPGDVGGVEDRSRGSAPHHTVLSTAVDTEQLVDFANLLGVEFLIIDGSINRRDFAHRICWNQAPYRLSPGALRQAF